MVPQISAVLDGMSLVLVVMAVEVLIMPHWVPCHLIWLFEEWFILDFFKNLTHRLSEHSIDRPSIGRPRLPSKISLRPVDIVST